jgi:hypothetical protein
MKRQGLCGAHGQSQKQDKLTIHPKTNQCSADHDVCREADLLRAAHPRGEDGPEAFVRQTLASRLDG